VHILIEILREISNVKSFLSLKVSWGSAHLCFYSPRRYSLTDAGGMLWWI